MLTCDVKFGLPLLSLSFSLAHASEAPIRLALLLKDQGAMLCQEMASSGKQSPQRASQSLEMSKR